MGGAVGRRRPSSSPISIQFEQLAATLAEAELEDMGLDDTPLRDRLAALLMRWRVRAAPAIEGPAISA